uniref:Uncharacterized protein n=1 Tax=Rhabditophanes sp. KR3021 TaxID=114890 RepID=A0AC35U9P9_9BILA
MWVLFILFPSVLFIIGVGLFTYHKRDFKKSKIQLMEEQASKFIRIIKEVRGKQTKCVDAVEKGFCSNQECGDCGVDAKDEEDMNKTIVIYIPKDYKLDEGIEKKLNVIAVSNLVRKSVGGNGFVPSFNERCLDATTDTSFLKTELTPAISKTGSGGILSVCYSPPKKSIASPLRLKNYHYGKKKQRSDSFPKIKYDISNSDKTLPTTPSEKRFTDKGSKTSGQRTFSEKKIRVTASDIRNMAIVPGEESYLGAGKSTTTLSEVKNTSTPHSNSETTLTETQSFDGKAMTKKAVNKEPCKRRSTKKHVKGPKETEVGKSASYNEIEKTPSQFKIIKSENSISKVSSENDVAFSGDLVKKN